MLSLQRSQCVEHDLRVVDLQELLQLEAITTNRHTLLLRHILWHDLTHLLGDDTSHTSVGVLGQVQGRVPLWRTTERLNAHSLQTLQQRVFVHRLNIRADTSVSWRQDILGVHWNARREPSLVNGHCRVAVHADAHAVSGINNHIIAATNRQIRATGTGDGRAASTVHAEALTA